MYEELVKRLREESEIERWLQPHSANETPKLLDDAADAIEELTDKNVGKWIPVTERLPERGYYVLVYEDGDILMASYADGNWVLRDMYEVIDDLKPTYWMPLPEPPKEET